MRARQPIRSIVIALVIAIAVPAHAGKKRRALATAASIVPGAFVHGSGHWVAGDRRTARRLLIAEALGLGLVVVGEAPIIRSGGAPETMPALALVIPGAALVITSWLADIYGAAGGAELGGRGRRAPPRVELETGALVVGDPRTGTHTAATIGASTWHANGHASAAGWAGGPGWEIRGELGARLLGGRPGRPGRDASHVDVVIGGGEQRFDDEGFRVGSTEVGARGRYDLARFAGSLSGSFVGLEVGLVHEWIRYRSAGDSVDSKTLLDARLGYGVYLGSDAEVELYYEHRRDTLAGSLLFESGANGILGHVGVRAEAFRGRWGVGASVEAGSAWVTRVSLIARLGEGER
jgi:hypothetical protein